MTLRLALVVLGLVCVVSHWLGIEAGHELHHLAFVAIRTYLESETT